MEFTDPTLLRLAEQLDSPDPGIRRVAVMELVDSQEPDAVKLLIRALNDDDPDVREEAARMVDEFDADDMADVLVEALNSPDENVRNAAAHALADLKDVRIAPSLILALEGTADPTVLGGILRALKPLRAPGACAAALNLLDHEDPRVRRESIGVIGYLRDPATLDALIARSQQDSDDDVRRAAVNALRFGSASRVGSPLMEALHDAHWQVRAEAAASLGRLQVQTALDALIRATDDEFWQVREKAVDALGQLKDVRAVDAVGQCTKDENSNLRKAAVCALGEIADVSAKPYLQRVLSDPDPDVRKLAYWAMNRLGFQPVGVIPG